MTVHEAVVRAVRALRALGGDDRTVNDLASVARMLNYRKRPLSVATDVGATILRFDKVDRLPERYVSCAHVGKTGRRCRTKVFGTKFCSRHSAEAQPLYAG